MPDLPYQKTTLPNGVRLLCIPVSGVNSIATSVMVGVGSRYETKSNNGISHFLEHMVFKGTEKYPTTDDVNTIEKIGGLQNAYTDIDITNYHNKVLSTDWEQALEINKELALSPLLEEVHVERERNVIIEEMKRYEDEPGSKVEEVFHSMMYPGTKLGMRTIGEEASLRAVASTELKAYHDAWYTPDRIVVVLAGNLTPYSSRITSRVHDWFSTLTNVTDLSNLEIVQDTQNTPQLSVLTKPDAAQAHLVLGFRAFARNSEDRFAWNVFNLLMGVSFTSRLFREIREKQGLCYHIRSSSNSWKDVGYWMIYAGVATDKVTLATRAILAELAKAVEKGITEEEVAVAKKRLVTMLAFKSEDPEFFAEFYGRQEVFGESFLTLEDYLARIEAVTKDEINQLLSKYIVSNHLNMALVWNKKSNENLKQLLRL